jgi:hypothetical protein
MGGQIRIGNTDLIYNSDFRTNSLLIQQWLLEGIEVFNLTKSDTKKMSNFARNLKKHNH